MLQQLTCMTPMMTGEVMSSSAWLKLYNDRTIWDQDQVVGAWRTVCYNGQHPSTLMTPYAVDIS